MKDNDNLTFETIYNKEIKIKIMCPNGRKVSYKIRKSLKIDKVLNNYCKRKEFDPERTRFIYKNGKLEFPDPDSDEKVTPFTLGKKLN
jgi:hypothetical protein